MLNDIPLPLSGHYESSKRNENPLELVLEIIGNHRKGIIIRNVRVVSSRIFGALFTCAEGHHAFWADIKKCKSMAKLSENDKERFISIRYLPTPVCQLCLLYKLQFTRPKLWWPTTKDIKLARGKQRHKNSKPLVECILGIMTTNLFLFSVSSLHCVYVFLQAR